MLSIYVLFVGIIVIASILALPALIDDYDNNKNNHERKKSRATPLLFKFSKLLRLEQNFRLVF